MEKNMNKHKRDIEQWKSETVQQVRKKKKLQVSRGKHRGQQRRKMTFTGWTSR